MYASIFLKNVSNIPVYVTNIVFKTACCIFYYYRRYRVLKLPDRTNFSCVRTAYTATTALYSLHTHRCYCVCAGERTRVHITTVCIIIIHQLVFI